MQLALMAEMLNVDPWRRYPLSVQLLSPEAAQLFSSARPLPPHVPVTCAPLEDLPIATKRAGHFVISSSLPTDCGWLNTPATAAAEPAVARTWGHLAVADSVESDALADESVSEDETTDSDSSASSSSGPSKAAKEPVLSPGACADCGQACVQNWFTCASYRGRACGLHPSVVLDSDTSDTILCRCKCGRVAHDECWAHHLLFDSKGNRLPQGTELPDSGVCPSCQRPLQWVDLLTKCKTVPRVHRQKPSRRRKRAAVPKAAKAASATAAAAPAAAPRAKQGPHGGRAASRAGSQVASAAGARSAATSTAATKRAAAGRKVRTRQKPAAPVPARLGPPSVASRCASADSRADAENCGEGWAWSPPLYDDTQPAPPRYDCSPSAPWDDDGGATALWECDRGVPAVRQGDRGTAALWDREPEVAAAPESDPRAAGMPSTSPRAATAAPAWLSPAAHRPSQSPAARAVHSTDLCTPTPAASLPDGASADAGSAQNMAGMEWSPPLFADDSWSDAMSLQSASPALPCSHASERALGGEGQLQGGSAATPLPQPPQSDVSPLGQEWDRTPLRAQADVLMQNTTPTLPNRSASKPCATASGPLPAPGPLEWQQRVTVAGSCTGGGATVGDRVPSLGQCGAVSHRHTADACVDLTNT